ncbi:hypothetical protein PTKIN_Ptkin04bG0098100 [Pterospermum kingtungense]
MEQKMGNINNGDFRIKEYMGSVAVHSQVRKIKKESEQIIDWSPEMRPLLRDFSTSSKHHLSSSPLGSVAH